MKRKTETQPPELKAIASNCGSCPHAIPSRVSAIFFECSLFGGLVQSHHKACDSVGGQN